MFLYTLLLVSCAPFAVLAGSPGPLKSLSGRDYSHHLKRTDEPFPIRLTVAKRGAAAVPRTLQIPGAPVARRSSPAGVLVAARQVSCDYGYSLCADGVGCCPTGAQCCTEEVLCCSGGACCGGSCCENNGVCCGSAGCCNSGNTCQTVNGVTGCCPAGQTCDAFSGCADPSLVECNGLPFCCPSGETCGRDSAGNATCNGHSASSDNSISSGASSVTPGNTSLSTPGSSGTSTTRGGSGSTTATVTSPQSTLTGSHTTTASEASSGGAFKSCSTVSSLGLTLVLGVIALVMN